MAIEINSNSISRGSMSVNINKEGTETIEGSSTSKIITDTVDTRSSITSIKLSKFLNGSVTEESGTNWPLTEKEVKITSSFNGTILTTTIEYIGSVNITNFTCEVQVTYNYIVPSTVDAGITFNSDGSISINCTSLKVNGKTIS